VAQLADAPHDQRSIVLIDVAGASLAGLATPLAADQLIVLARRLAMALIQMHPGRVLDCNITPAAFFVGDHVTKAWLSLEAPRIWLEHGLGPALVGSAANAAFAPVTQRDDYSAGYRAAQRVPDLDEAAPTGKTAAPNSANGFTGGGAWTLTPGPACSNSSSATSRRAGEPHPHPRRVQPPGRRRLAGRHRLRGCRRDLQSH
jgi:hypothetical protein